MLETLNLTLETFNHTDKIKAQKVLEHEDMIDTLVKKYRKRHVKRTSTVKEGNIDDDLFVDILSNVERIGDHCQNIVMNVLQDHYYIEEKMVHIKG